MPNGIRNSLTLKQNQFANTYLETGNATEAATQAYKPKNRNTAHAIGAENLRKPAIRAYLDEKAEDAMSMVFRLSQKAKSENVRLNASKDILDRAGYFVNKTQVAESKQELPTPILVKFLPSDEEQRAIDKAFEDEGYVSS